jgi:flagellar biosynthesis GTPase FlhF
MATESNVRSAHGVRTYRGRTLEEILPQIREELGPDAIILREREGLVGGVGGFFAQRFIEVEARRGDGQSIDIYDDAPDSDLGNVPPAAEAVTERQQPLLSEAGEPRTEIPPAPEEPVDFTARRQTPVQPPIEPSEPRPFDPPVVQRERIVPKLPPQPEPAPPTRRFETDVFLERLRAASAILPDEDEDEDLAEPDAGAAPAASMIAPSLQPEPVDEPAEPEPSEPPPAQAKPPRPERRPPPERKPRSPQRERPRPAPRPKAAPKPALQAPPEPEPEAPPEPAAPPTAPRQPAPAQAALPPAPPNPYETVRQRPTSLQAGLPTARPSAAVPAPIAPAPAPAGVYTTFPGPPRSLELHGGHAQSGIRGALARLLGARFGRSSTPRPSAPRPIDPVAATEIATELGTPGASQTWTSQLISTAAAHGSPLAGSLRAAAEAEVARRIVSAPALPVTGAAVAFIGAGGTGKTRCTAALASAYSRASTLGVTVIALDNPDGAHELNRLLSGDGVPVLSLSGERARRAIEAARQGGFVIVDTPTATPTDPAQVDALAARLAPLELDATYVTLPATLGPQAARRALGSFGRLHPSAVAITHVDETDQLAVVVEIAIAHRIPLAYLHAGADHQSALTAVDATALAQQLLGT